MRNSEGLGTDYNGTGSGSVGEEYWEEQESYELATAMFSNAHLTEMNPPGLHHYHGTGQIRQQINTQSDLSIGQRRQSYGRSLSSGSSGGNEMISSDSDHLLYHPTVSPHPSQQQQLFSLEYLNNSNSNQVAPQVSLPATSKDSTFVMDVSPSVVGWIIGRSGLRIKEIQAHTGCKMWLDQDVPDDQPRKIFFHGTPASIEEAVSRVSELVQFAPILANSKIAAGHNLTSTIFDCPPPLVGMVIGKKGWTIKKIQEVSGAQISINQSVREGLPRKVIVSGDQEAVNKALELIGDLVRDKASLLKIELPAVLTMNRTNIQPLRGQYARQQSSPSFLSSNGAIHQDPYLIFADHEPSPSQHMRPPVPDPPYFPPPDYHSQPVYRAQNSLRTGIEALPTPPPSRPDDLLRLHQRYGLSDPRDNRAPHEVHFPPSRAHHPNISPQMYKEEILAKYIGTNHPPQQYLTLDHPALNSSLPPDKSDVIRRTMRSHSAGSIGHLYDQENILQQQQFALSPQTMPIAPIEESSNEDLYASSKRPASHRISFNPSAPPDQNSPRSVGRGYSFASSKSEFHSFETTDLSSTPSTSQDSYRRLNQMYPITRSSEGFTSGEYSEAEHSHLYSQRLPSPPVQLDMPAWHSINRSLDGSK